MRFPALARTIWDLPTRLSLRAGLLLLLSGMALAVIYYGISNTLDRRAERIEHAQETLAQIARGAAQRQTDLFTEARTLLGVLGDLPAPFLKSQPLCHDTLLRAVDEIPWLTSLSNFSTNGTAICSSQDTLPTARVIDRDYFRRAIASNSFVLSNYVISRVTNIPVVLAAMPRTEGEEITSVLIASITLEWLSRVVADASNPPGTLALVVDSVGTVIAAHPYPRKWVGTVVTDNPQFRDLIGGTEGVSETVDASGERWIAASQPLPNTGASVIVEQPQSQVLAEANRKAIVEFATILLLVAVSFVAVWLGGERLLVRPMRLLIHTAEKIGGGELAARVATDGMAKDLQVLGGAFNRMAGELARRDAELTSANNKLRELAATDGLTGLANRRRFDETYEAEWNRAARDVKPLAVIYIDVDHFKKFNDRYGHIAGDGSLRAVAQVIRNGARRPGDLAGRTGGEEFALVLPGATAAHAIRIAEELRQHVQALGVEHADNPGGLLTISLGVAALTPSRGQRPTILLEWADKALYSAKERGRNRVVQAATGLAIAS